MIFSSASAELSNSSLPNEHTLRKNGDLKLGFPVKAMLYCYHFEGDGDEFIRNDGVGTQVLTISGMPAVESKGALCGTKAPKSSVSGAAYSLTDNEGIGTFEQGWTLSFWFHPNGTTRWNDACGFKIGDNIYKLEHHGDGAGYDIYRNTSNGLTPLIDGSELWHNVVVVQKPNIRGIDIYVDGILNNSAAWSTGDATALGNLTQIIIGTSGLSGGRPSTALVDEVAVFNAALTQQQIAWLSTNQPSEAVFNVEDVYVADSTAFGVKVIGLKDDDVCTWGGKALCDSIAKSHVGQNYDQVVVTLFIDLPKTTAEMKIVSVNESSNAGASGNKADLWWDGSKLYLGHNGANTNSKTEVIVSPGLHLVSMTVVNGNVATGTMFIVDGDYNKKAIYPGLRWTGNYPTGTFTYQGDIKSITLDFSSSNAVSGLDALPKFTLEGELVKDLSTIGEILEMTAKSISDTAFSVDTIAADVSLGSIIETVESNTIGITIETSLDLPCGEVTILVENETGDFDLLENSPTLISPRKNDSRTILLSIDSLLNGAKSRLFKIQAKPAK